MDITNEIKDTNMIQDMQNKYMINSISALDVPTVLVIDNGVLRSAYSVKANNYDISKLIAFINNIKFDSDSDYNG